MSNNKHQWYTVLFGVCTIFLGVSFFVWTLPANFQMVRYSKLVKQALKTGDISHFTDTQFAFTPDTYVQPELRSNFVHGLFTTYQQRGNPAILRALPFAIAKLEQAMVHRVPEAKYYFTLAEGYSMMGKLHPEKPEYYAQSEQYYQQALALMPRYQPIIYGYGLTLVDEKKYDQAIALLKEAVASDPRVTSSHYYLELAYAYSDPKYYNDALAYLENSFEKNEIGPVNLDSIRTLYTKFFSYYYQKGDIDHFQTVIERLSVLDADPGRKDLYKKIYQYIQTYHRLPKITIQ